jgi:cob(I)alamin adenosyltransferase
MKNMKSFHKYFPSKQGFNLKKSTLKTWNGRSFTPMQSNLFCTNSKGENSIKKIPIYTKTGDKGTSMLFNGERRNKNDEIFEALGTTDELNSNIGFAREFCIDFHTLLAERLEQTQSLLLDVGSHIATPRNQSSSGHLARTNFDEVHVSNLERWIDEMDNELPPLKNFILPSGGKASASLHVARSVCRRAERTIVPLVQQGSVDASVGKYINRLSDFLFMAARFVALKEGKPEVIYKKQRN